MSDVTEKPGKKMPTRKGGTRYPRCTLEDCLVWARKLVSKTHSGPQPADLVLAGVVGATSSTGEIRLSALKQYGLLEGTSKGYSATALAKRIASAPPSETQTSLREAALSPTIFKQLFDTYHTDSVTKAKLKQRAAELQVHPDETERCIEIYCATILVSGLGFAEGDKISHASPQSTSTDTSINSTFSETPTADSLTGSSQTDVIANVEPEVELPEAMRPMKAVFNVNVTLDSSLDTEKLERQLQLLKRYGAI